MYLFSRTRAAPLIVFVCSYIASTQSQTYNMTGWAPQWLSNTSGGLRVLFFDRCSRFPQLIRRYIFWTGFGTSYWIIVAELYVVCVSHRTHLPNAACITCFIQPRLLPGITGCSNTPHVESICAELSAGMEYVNTSTANPRFGGGGNQ